MRKALLLLLLCAAGFGPVRARQVPPQPVPPAPEATPAEDGRRKLRVFFQSGDVSGNVARVLMILKQLDALHVNWGSHPEGLTAAQAYTDKLDLPRPSAALNALAEAINQKPYGDRKLGDGERVLYPDVDIDPFEVVKTYDLNVKDDAERLENDRQKWADHITEKQQGKAKAKLKLTAFELKVRVEDPLKLNRAIDEIRKIAPAEVRVASRKVDVERPAHLFTVALEGGDTTKDAGHVLRVLVGLKLVRLDKHTVGEGETVESIYKEALKIPASLVDLAGELNDTNYRRRSIRPGDVMNVPAASFERYQWIKTLNLQSAEGSVELERIRANWGHVMVAETQKAPDVVQVELAGYRLSVNAGSAVKLAAARAALAAIPSRNVVLSFPPSQSQSATTFYARSGEDIPPTGRENQKPEFWWKECCVEPNPDGIEEGKQAWMGDYINLPEPPAIEKRCTGANCPQIVLLDALPAPHPDIAAAIIDDDDNEGIAGTLVKGKKQEIRQKEFEKDKDHGTHLAGIIASQDNDFGLVGINPRARIYPIQWDVRDTSDKLAGKITDRAKKSNFQIWVFASEWPLDLKSGVATKADKRFQDLRAKRIKDISTSLWITAAGDGAREISWSDTTAPMNLGDQPNVIVVTACEGCYGNSPRIEPHSNYSARGERMVHLAAPGQKVPSTVTEGRYAMGGGTSQATAFVAGVASAMASSYDHYRFQPWLVKFRLQVTARPSLTGDDSSRVAAGILDPSVALLDPDISYADTGSGKLEVFSPKGWCTKTLHILENESGTTKSVITEKIYRIVRTQGNDWVVFYADDAATGEVFKIGPGRITDPDANGALLLTKRANTTDGALTFSQFSDLLISSKGLKFTPAVCAAVSK